MAVQLGSAYAKVELDSSGIKRGVEDGVKNLNKLAQAGQLIGGSLQRLGGLMTVGLTLPIAAFMKTSIDASIASESALADLKATIASTGGVAGVTAEEVTDMASALQKVTKFADDDIISGQAMLLTFTKIGKEVFPQATEAMLNMAEKFGSIEQASVQLGKALNDPILGVTALRRVGVMLTKEQEEQIKGFIAVNDVASAQKVILQELEVEFGGLARAAGDTTAGKIAQLKNAFDDLQETVGDALIPLLLPLIAGLTRLVEKFQELSPFQQKMIIGFLGIVALMGPMLVFFGTIITGISSLITLGTTLGGLGISFTGIATAVGSIGTAVSAVAVPALGALGAALLPILAVLAAVVASVAFLAVMWKTNFLGMRDNWTAGLKIMQNVWKAFTSFLSGDSESAIEYLQEAWNTFVDWFNLTFERVFKIKDAWQKFMQFMRDALGKLVSYIRDSFTRVDWGQVGRYILTGLANGMLLGIPSMLVAAKKVSESLLAQIKKSLGIASPSAEAMKLGMFTAQGFQMGLQRVSPEDMARALVRPITNSSSSQQQTIVQNFSSGLTVSQARAMIAQNNEELVNTMIGALNG